MNSNTISRLIALACVALSSCAVGQTGGEQTAAAGEAIVPAESVTVTVDSQQELRPIPGSFLGINLSYFNDTDEIWEKHGIQDKVKKAGIGALRYPGGEETSFFHWEHPGVNGYEDIYDDPATYGNPRGRGPFQVTWVDPKDWETNENFMSFDDYMARCRALGAEPVVGLNLSSGRRHDRREAGLEEALRWMRYCKANDFNVTYWFLDNETWHYEAAHTFSAEEYAEDVVYFGKAIKAEFPDVKLIVNPASSETINHTEGIKQFIETAGGVIDYIDMHWYWSWGTSSWEKWLTQAPMRSGDQWKDDWMDRPFGDDVEMIRKMCRDAGYPEVGVVVLEWNVGPSEHTWDLPDSAMALIQSQMLMEFLDGDVRMTCLWTLLWQSRREVWPVQDRFQSILTHEPPHKETASFEMFRLFSSVLDMTQITAESSADDVRVVAAKGGQGNDRSVILLNKSDRARKVTVRFDSEVDSARVGVEYINLEHAAALQLTPDSVGKDQVVVELQPYSFTALRVQ